MEFFDWNMLLSFGGASLAVAVLTQMSKELPLVKRIPTRLWSYLLSLLVLLAACHFTGGLNLSAAVLNSINAALVSLAANGGYDAVGRIKEGLVGPTE